jgi:hypothetical protein
MSTFGLANTVPLVDFAQDPEDLVYKYIGANWTITTPSHINKLALFQTEDSAEMINRPSPGNRPVWLWVQHFDLDSARSLPGSSVGRTGMIKHNHTFNINLMSTRLTQGLTFPDLGILSREIERILYTYEQYTIQGIQQFDHFRMLPIVEAAALGGVWYSFPGTYLVACQITAAYHKLSTV